MAVYFVRHGQTPWNIEKRIQGRADIEINEEGEAQARQTRDELAGAEFAAIISSPLKRAYRTAEIIARKHSGIPLIVEPALCERDFGEFEGRVNDGNFFGLWNFGKDRELIVRGETTEQLYERVRDFLDRIRGGYKDRDVLLVAHGGVGVIIEAYYRGIPEDGNLLVYVARNGEVRRYEV